MALTCPSGRIFYFPNANQGDVLPAFDLSSDFGITDDGGEQVFFLNAILVSADDANGDTFYDQGGNTTTTFREAGFVTNTGNTITYTVDDTMQPGDVITIAYSARNSSQTDNCEDIFQIAFKEEENTGGGDLTCVSGREYTFNEGATNSSVTVGPLVASNSAGGTPVFASAQLVNSSGVVVNNLTTGGTLTTIPSSVAAGVYTLRYTITSNGETSAQCTATIRINAVNQNPLIECSNSATLSFGQAGGSVTAASLATSNNTGQSVIFLEKALYTSTGVLINNLTAGTETATIPASLASGNYVMRYRLTNAARNDSVECNINITISDDSGNGSNLDCARTRWANGITPSITCGSAASLHVATLIKTDGSPLTDDASALDFVRNSIPTGVEITVVGHDGNGNYTFRIDPSNANCFGTTSGSLGV